MDIPYAACPKATVTWLKEAVALKETTRVNTEATDKNLRMVIKEACRDDVGTYTIKLHNTAGDASADIKVVVFDKPGPPTGPIKMEEVTSDSVILSWNPPEYDGSCSINNYIVEKRDTSTTNWQIVSATVARTTIKAARLKTGCEYQFRIAAENRYGKSSVLLSETVIAQYPFEVPSHPRSVSVQSATKESMVVVWDKPSNDGGSKILGYHIEVCAINKVGVGEHADFPGKILLEEKLEAPDLDLDAEMRKMINIRSACTLRLFVPVRGRPAPEVKWSKADGEIKETAQIDNTGNYASLVIENVDRFDSGKYILTAENASGVKSVFISVRVHDSPSPPTNFIVKEITKNSVSLTWEPPLLDGGAKIKHYIVEKRESTRKVYSPVTTCNRMSWKIEPLPEGGIFFFRVSAENEYGVGLPAKTLDPIKISEKPQPPGKVSVVDVTNSTVTLTWEKPIHDGGSRISSYEVEVAPKDSEAWSVCAAVKAIETTDLVIEPIDPPEVILDAELRKGIVVRACGSMRICIPFKGRPTPEISWSKEDGELPSKVQIETGEDYSQLSIDICDRYDAGKYILKLENSAGTKTAFVSVKVLDTPGAPINLTVKDIKRQSVTLTWEPPVIDGGARIKNYLVERRESTRNVFSNVDNKCTKTSYRITGLTEGTIYYFRVLAENEFGVGQSAETEDAVKCSEPPLPVGKVALTDVTKSTASLSWEKPDHDGGSRIMGYYIEMQPVGSEEWVVAATTKTCEGTVAGLSAGHEYLFRVSAFNEKGKSDHRALASPVTAKDVTVMPGFKIRYNTYSLQQGEDLKIEIPVLGRPAPKVEWKKEGQALKETTRLNVSSTATSTKLLIKDANRDDSGKYTLTATSPPTGPVKIEEVSSDYVTLSWEPPEYTGGCQINNYIVEKRDTTTTAWQIVSATIARATIKVTKLKTGVEYQFRVSAENRYGKSPAILSPSVIAQYPFTEPASPGTPVISSVTKDNMRKEKNSLLWTKLNKLLIPEPRFRTTELEEVKECIRVDGGHFTLKLVNVGGVKMIPVNVKVLDRPGP
uniref:Titin n=1 Tax=Neogobius melanostomus TaxID=47308 RepID=A0A8C6U6P6_9GOBI